MDAPSLPYLFAHPTAIGVDAIHPFALFLLAGIGAFFVWRHQAGTRASVLRAAAFACLVLALAGVHLTIRVPADHCTLVAAVDLSDSIDDEGRDWSRRYVNELAAATRVQ